MITTRALGKRYACKGKNLWKLRRRLSRLEYLEPRTEKGGQTFPILKDLPDNSSAIMQEYLEKFHAFTVAEAAEEFASVVETLTEEVDDWVDNVGSYEGLNQTESYQLAENCQAELEYMNIDDIRDVPDSIGELCLVARIPYDTYLLQGRSRYIGRGRQAANAAAVLSAAIDHIPDEIKLDPDVEEWCAIAADRIIDLEQIEFPTMGF